MAQRSPFEDRENTLQERIPDILRKEILEDSSIPLGNRAAIAQLLIKEGLAGIDTPEAAQLIRDTPEATVAMGLAQLVGISTSAAEALRQHHFDQQTHPESLAASLAGVNTPLSWDIRQSLVRNSNTLPMSPQNLTAMDTEFARTLRSVLLSSLESQKQDLAQKMPGLKAKLTFKDEAELVDPRLKDIAASGQAPDRMVLVLANEMLEHTEMKAPLDHPDKETLREIDEANAKFLELCRGEADLIASLAGIDSDHAWEIRYKTLRKILSLKDIGTVSSIPEDELTIKVREEIGVDTMSMGGQPMKQIDRRETYGLRLSIVQRRYRDLLENGLSTSLMGLDSQETDEMRAYFFDPRAISPDSNENNRATDYLRLQNYGLMSLAGANSPHDWQTRNQALQNLQKYKKIGRPLSSSVAYCLANSLAGLDSEEAEQMRTTLIDEGFLTPEGKICSLNTSTMAAIRASRKFNLPAEPRKITAETFFPQPKQPKQTAGASPASLAKHIYLAVLERLKPRD